MQNARIECQECGKELNEEQRPCPYCGSNKPKYKVKLEGTLTPESSLGYKQKDSKGFLKIVGKIRHKISGVTKRPTRETITFDRTNPNFTKKLHHVEEIDKEGQAKVVHDEEEIYPAKRRQKTP
jgi:hypothetical protein